VLLYFKVNYCAPFQIKLLRLNLKCYLSPPLNIFRHKLGLALVQLHRDFFLQWRILIWRGWGGKIIRIGGKRVSWGRWILITFKPGTNRLLINCRNCVGSAKLLHLWQSSFGIFISQILDCRNGIIIRNCENTRFHTTSFVGSGNPNHRWIKCRRSCAAVYNCVVVAMWGLYLYWWLVREKKTGEWFEKVMIR